MLVGITLLYIAPGESGEALLLEYDSNKKRWEPGRKVIVNNRKTSHPVGWLKIVTIIQGGDGLFINSSQV